jgi:DNA-binding NtrC family response regulator
MSRVLFVSHDANLRAVASRVLTGAGFHVCTVSHAGHASLACLEGTAFDVLVVENRLYETNVSAVAARLRRYCPDLQVVRLCDPGTTMVGEGMAVVRPLSADDLIDAVLRASSTIPVA